MKIFYPEQLKAFLLIAIFFSVNSPSWGQNTSNKGTDFWIGYTGHINGTGSQMNLYITSDVNTSGTVSVPLQGWSTTFNVTANNTTIIPVPPNIAYDGSSGTILNNGIHVNATSPIVVYSHIYALNKSDATLVLPVPALGKEYYTMGFTQGNIFGGTGYAEFMVVGVDDSTQVEITPTQNTLDGHTANVPFTITINQGQVYQMQATKDLTGSHIVTFSTTSAPCQRVAVFSGSTYTALGCSGGGSGDNLYQQLYPINAWGNNFVTVPFKTRIGGDYFRVMAGNDSTLVSINGATPFRLNTAQFHDTLMAEPSYITATKPVTLAQYQRTQNCDNVTGDPSMTILNPVEQTLDTIALYSTPNYQITGEYINVIIKAIDTAAFRLDGNHVPFSVIAANTLYAYSQNTVASGNHILASDSGFNAIAYGFGQFESYGYNAGANVQNLVQFIRAGSSSSTNPHVLCKGSVVNFNGIVSYNPATRKWYFGDGDTSSAISPSHTYNNLGTYTVSFVTVRGNGSGCDIKDSSTYTLTIIDFPTANFTFSNTCVSDSVSFIDGSAAGGGSIVTWKWYFGDGDSSSLKNPFHHYASAGNYSVQLIVKSNGGCTNTITKQVSINPRPVVNAGQDKDLCLGSSVNLSTSTTGGGFTYQWSPAINLSCSTCSSTNASPSDTQVYIIRTTLNGCSGFDTVRVNVIKALASIVQDSVTMCAGNSIVINTATQPGQTYSWTPATGLTCSTCSITNASPSATTKYIVTSTYKTCEAKDTVVVQVITPSAKSDTSICPGGTVVMQALPNSPGYTYQWSPSTGLSCLTCQSVTVTPASLPVTYYVVISSNTCNAVDSVVIKEVKVPANAGRDTTICTATAAVLSASGGVSYRWSLSGSLSAATGSSPVASPTVNTTYTVVVTDSKGCRGNDTVVVRIFLPSVVSARPDTIVCPGTEVILQATGGVSYSWEPSSSLDNNTLSSPRATVNAFTVYTVSITDQHHCVENKNVTVAVFDPPFVIAYRDTIICKNKPLQLTATGASTYVWSGAEILGCSTCSVVDVGTQSSGIYTVIGTDDNGCKGTDNVTVALSPFCQFVSMPSAFSPNNDGLNDLFRPVGKGIAKVEYSIFDRWGNKLYTGNNLIDGWDGYYNGKLQPVATYVWELTATLDDGSIVTQQGNVELIR